MMNLLHFKKSYLPYAYMLASNLFASIMVIGVRHLAGEGLHPFYIAFLRIAAATILMTRFTIKNLEYLSLKSSFNLYLARGLLACGTTVSWFYSIGTISLGTVMSMSFTTPIFASITAAILLKEKVSKYIIVSLLLGFAGVLFINHVDQEIFSPKSLPLLLSSVLYSFNYIIIKKLSEREHPIAVVIYLNIFMLPFLILFAFPYMKMINIYDMIVVVIIAVCGNICQYLNNLAFKSTKLSSVIPLNFSLMVYVSILTYLIFGEKFSLETWVGAILIITGSIITVRKNESQASK